MALLRQCLQQLRVKPHDWDVPDDTWPRTMLRGFQEPELVPHSDGSDWARPLMPALRAADAFLVGAGHA